MRVCRHQKSVVGPVARARGFQLPERAQSQVGTELLPAAALWLAAMERALFAQLLTAPVAEMSIFPQSQSASRRRTPLVLVFLLRTFLSVLVSLSPICFCPAPEQSAAASPLWLVRPAQVDF